MMTVTGSEARIIRRNADSLRRPHDITHLPSTTIITPFVATTDSATGEGSGVRVVRACENEGSVSHDESPTSSVARLQSQNLYSPRTPSASRAGR
ncbi:hypothetical protein C0Q70_04061 [Pomacea canaliculata]|uniref:Uncharacterized protein n=1 Tax=Pomacea canaliculata TaxID=400727 RepID=A0A2T7PUH7_POMCA|nr:hypothetical protein C0Q70_04061 [Pomacea canaliculata]